MLRPMLRVEYLLPMLLLAGMAQYGFVAYSAVLSGNVALWTIDSTELASAGLLRYVKDAFVAGVSVAWLLILPRLRLPRELIQLVHVYFLWLGSVVAVGLVGFLLGYSPLFFLPAGLRWMLLLHAAFGVFVLSSGLVIGSANHKSIYRFFGAMLLLHGIVVVLQGWSVGVLNLAVGASRLTGVFSNAGVAANFVLAVALIVSHLDGVRLKKKILVIFVCLFLALSSGTRYATGAIFLIVLSQLWELMDESRLRAYKKIFFPLAGLAIFIGYQALIAQVDRGDAISQQFGTGGRVANFLLALNLLSSADIIELLFGRGLGIGTNTAIGALLGDGLDPSLYRFNLLADNALVTGFYQFGLIGSLVFWLGLIKFILFAKPKYLRSAKPRFFVTVAIILMTVILGSPFEQYFLMIAFASALGAVYWSDQANLKHRLVSHDRNRRAVFPA